MKRFVRPGAFLLLAALLFCLSGCYSGNIDQYFSLPMASEEYQQLQSLIDTELASGSEYAAPTHGSYRQSVQLSDVDGDGVDEALAFFRDGGKNPKINIYSSENGEYRLVLSLSGEGSSIGRIDYADLTGDGQKELLVSWQISSGVSILSALAVQEAVAAGQLLQFELDETPVRRSIYMARRRKSSMSSPARTFAELVRKQAKASV